MSYDDMIPAGASLRGYENQAKMVSMPTMKQRLEMAVKDAQQRLDNAKEARALFDKNPDLERLLDLLQRNNF